MAALPSFWSTPVGRSWVDNCRKVLAYLCPCLWAMLVTASPGTAAPDMMVPTARCEHSYQGRFERATVGTALRIKIMASCYDALINFIMRVTELT